MKKFTILSFLIMTALVGARIPVAAQIHKPDDIIGVWLNEEATGKIQIYKEKDKYFGKLVWLREPIDKATGLPKSDKENPNPSLQSAPVIGLVNLKDFTFDGKEEWSGGTIYDPKNGKTYKCFIRFENQNKLKIRGFIGISMLGRNTYWTRSTHQP